MYSFRQVFKQEPNAIREVVLLTLGVLVALDVIQISEEVTAMVGVLISALLGLFYVRPLSVSRDAIRELDGDGA